MNLLALLMNMSIGCYVYNVFHRETDAKVEADREVKAARTKAMQNASGEEEKALLADMERVSAARVATLLFCQIFGRCATIDWPIYGSMNTPMKQSEPQNFGDQYPLPPPLRA